MAEIVARVTNLIGKAYARDMDGNVRELRNGSPIREGDVVQTADGGRLQLTTVDGRNVGLGAGEAIKLDAEVAAPGPLPDATTSSVQVTQPMLAKISRTVVGQDGTFSFEDDGGRGTGSGADNSERHSFVELARVIETVDPLVFQFSTTRFQPLDSIRGDIVPKLLVSAGVVVSGHLDPSSDSGTVGDLLTNDATPTLVGTATPGATIEVATPSGVLTTVATAAGTWTLNLPSPLPDGTASLTVTARDTLGGVANTTISFTVDTVISLTAQLAPASDTAQVGDNLTRDDTPTVQGTGEPGASITVISPTGEVLTTTVAADGTWSVTPTVALPDGLARFDVATRDAAGNTANTTVNLTVDTTISLTAQLAPSSDSGTADDSLTNDNTPMLRGTGEPGASITVTSPTGEVLTTTVVADGTWSVTPTMVLPDGPARFDVVTRDAAGNTANTTVNLTVDTMAVASILVNPVTPDNILNAVESGLTITVTGTASGDAKAGDMVTLLINGNVYTGILTAGLTYSIDVAGSDLAADTTIDASVAVTDAAGNAATAATIHTHVVDTVATGAPTVIITEDANNDGRLSLAEINGQADVRISLPAGSVAGDTLSVTDGTTTQTFVLTSAQIGAGFVDTTLPPPADGSTLLVTATVTDQAGNASLPGSDFVSRDSTPPVATNVSAQGNEDAGSISITLSATDAGGPIAGYTVTTVPANGVLYSDAALTQAVVAGAMVSSPTLFFVPAADWSGNAAFNYSATDLAGNVSTVATAGIVINPVSDAPTLTVTPASGAEDNAIALAITVAESDVDGSEVLGNVTIGNVPAGSVLSAGTNNGDGTWTLTPAQLSGLTITPPANFNGTLNLSVSALSQDGSAALAASNATLVVTVTPVNDAPVAVAVSGSGAEDAASISVALSASDIDGTIASYTISSLPANGTLYADAGLTTVVTAGATVSGATLYFVPNANWNGSTGFNYTATDNLGAVSNSAAATITVTPVNDAPVAVAVSGSGAEDAASISVALSASDIDGTIASYTISSLPANGTLYADAGLTTVVTAGATVSGATLYFVPNANWNGSTGFNYTATDNLGAVSNSAAATITVTPVNDAPVAVAVSGSGAEDAASISVALSASDIDGTIASYTISSLPANGTLYADAGLTTVVTAGATVSGATLYFVPNANWNGSTGFNYTATDNLGAVSNSAAATITVTPVNDAPVAVAVSGSGAEDAASISVALSASDIDGTIASYTISSLPANGTLYADAGLTTVVTAGATVSGATLYFVPNANWNGSTGFNYTATDNLGAVSNSAAATITVTPVNDAPVAVAVSGSGAEDAASISVALSASDIDGTIASYTISSLPANGTLYADAGLTTVVTAGATVSGATLYFVPNANWNGSTGFNYTATDNLGAVSNSAAATITVTPVNDAPVAVAVSGSGAEDAASISVALSASDIDGTIASYTISSLPANGTLYADAGLTTVVTAGATVSGATLYFVPNANWNGSTGFNYTATDNLGAVSNSAAATITVTPVNDAPVAVAVSGSGAEDAASISVALSASDIDGTIASYTISSLPANGTLYADAGLTTVVTAGATVSGATLYFVPNANWNGSTGFNYTATDNLGAVSNSAAATITVTPVNDAPVAVAVSGSGAEDAASISVALSASDIDGTIASYTISSLPANGTLYADAGLTTVVTAGATVSGATLYFVPNANWNGSTGFNYTATDNLGAVSNSAAATITVTPVNDAPVAVAVSGSGAEDAASISVALSASDIDGTIASYTISSLPANGTLYADAGLTTVVTAGATVSGATLYFVPNANWNGSTGFNYTATDNLGAVSNSAAATITVTPVNDAPVAVAVSGSGAEDAASISVALSASDIDGTIASYTISSLPANGTLYADAGLTTVVTAGATVSGATLYFVPNANWNGSTGFNYTATDNLGAVSNSAAATITVTPVNDAPVAVAVSGSGAEDAASISVALSASDIDGTIASYTISSLPANGTLYADAGLTTVVTAGATVSGATLYFVPNANWNGSTGFNYTATDNLGAVSNSAAATITVTPVNDAPVAVAVSGSGAEDAASISVALSASDIDGTIASYTISSLPANGTLYADAGLTTVVTAGATVSGATLYFVPNANWNGSTGFNYTATDNLGAVSNSAAATITVTPVNDAPVAVAVSGSGAEDAASISVALSASDIDGTIASYTISSLPANGTLYADAGLTTVVTAGATVSGATLYFVPNANWNGSTGFNYTATDNLGAVSNSAAATITVTPVNDAPVAVAVSGSGAEDAASISVALSASDIDGTIASYTISSLPANGTLYADAGLTTVVTAGATVSGATLYFVPNANWNGSTGFNYTATDNLGAVSNSAAATITVTPVNDAPVAVAVSGSGAEDAASISVALSASDIDGTIASYTISSLPANGTLYADAGLTTVVTAGATVSGATLYFVPNANWNGSTGFNYTATDNLGAVSNSAAATITVTPVNDAPVAVAVSGSGAEDAASISVALSASDIDGTIASYTISSLPANGTLYADAGLTTVVTAGATVSGATLYFVPNANWNGSTGFNYTATDNLGAVSNSAAATITVTPVNDAPVAVAVSGSGAEDAASISVALSASDIDGTIASYTISSLPANGTLYADAGLTTVVTAGATVSGATLYFVPNANWNGSTGFNYTATDNLGAVSNSAAATITVTPVNDAPVAVAVSGSGAEDAASISVALSASDIDGTIASYTISSLPANGTLYADAGLTTVVTAGATVSGATLYFVPNANWNGSTGFNYTATDNLGAVSNSAAATITVTPVNDAPVAVAVSGSGAEDAASISVALSASDIDGTIASYTISSLPANGTLYADAGLTTVVTAGATVSGATLYFVPNANWNGSTGFNYTATDNLGAVSNSAAATITVTPVNDAPVAVAVSGSGAEDAASISVALSASDIDGTIASYTISSLPANGTLYADAGLTTVVTAGATVSGATLYFVPNANWNGSTGFNYTATDNLGAVSNSAAATITVTPVNDAPVAVAVSGSGAEDAASISVALSASDIDGTIASYTISSLPANGTLYADAGLTTVVTAGATVSGATLYFVPNANWNGSTGFNYTATDNLGAVSNSAAATITVTPVNDAPVAVAVSGSGAEDAASISVALSASDIDGTIASYTISSLPANGTLYADAGLTTVVTAGATVSGATLYFVPNANWNGSTGFNYTATDNLGAVSNSAAATITVTPVNDAPVAVAVSGSGAEDAASISVALSASDIDGTIASYTISSLPANGTLYADAGLTTVVTAGATVSGATLYFVPNANWNGSTGFNYTATDNLGAVSNSAAATITVTPVNDAPVAVAVSGSGAEDAASISVALSASDIDGTIASYTISSLPANGTLYADAGLTTVVTAGATVSGATLYFVPNANWNGSTGFNYTATDNLGAVSNSAAATITVTPVNDAPVAVAVSGSGAEDAASISVALSASDIDGTIASYTISSLPANGTLYADAGLTTVVTAGATVSGATLYFVPNANWNGSTGFNYTATDNLGAVSNSAAATITVTPVNDAPVAVAVSGSGAEDAASISVALSASDIDGTIASYTISSLPANGTLYADAGLTTVVTAGATVSGATLYFVPNANWNGSTGFNYTATDNLGAVSNSAAATITVTPVNDAPVAVAVSGSGAEDAASISVALSASDIDGTIASYTISSLPANGTLYADAGLTTVVTAGATVSGATLYFVPNANWNGSTGFNYTATDNLGAVSNSAAATITVTPVNDAPVAVAVSGSGAEDAASISVALSASDIDGTIASYTISSLPANGTLYADAGLTTVVTAGATVSGATLYFVPNANWNGSTGFNYTATDNLGAVSNSAAATITVTPVNDAPVAVAVSGSGAEDAASISVALSASDIDGTIASYTISSLPANGTLYADAGLTTVVTAGATVSGATLYFVPNANWNGSTGFNYTATDNLGAVSNSAAATITVTPVNDAPTLDLDGSTTGGGYSTTFTENGAAVRVVDSDLTISDVDSASYSGATIMLTNAQAGDVLAIGAVPSNITVTQVGNTITLSGNGSAGDYRAALLAVTFANTTENPSATPRTISVSMLDDAGLASNVAVSTVNVTPVNDPPVLDLDANNSTAAGSGFVTYVARNTLAAGAVSIADTDVSISDLDHTQLTGATVTLTNGTTVNQSLLAWAGADASGITATVAADGLSVTISGTASLAAYQAALQNVKFASNNNTTGAFNVNVVVTDGVGNSNTASTTVNVVSSLRPIAFAATAAGSEDPATPIAITLNGDDPNGTVNSFRIDSLPTNGTLYRDAAKTLAVATGTDYAASGQALTLYFQPNANWSGNATFTFSAKDNGGSYSAASATGTVAVAAVADTPNLATTNSFTEVFNTSWESQGPLTATADDRNNATHAKGGSAIEGWTLLTTSGVTDTAGSSGGRQANQFYFNADGDKIGSTLFTAAGMTGSPTGGDSQNVFLHLDNAANGTVATPNYQTLGISRNITVSDATQVYQLSFNYAPDDVAAANSGIEVLVDGVVAGSYSLAGTGATALNWQTISVGFKFSSTGSHSIAIRTTSPESGSGVGAYIDDVRLVAAQGAMQWTNSSSSYGGATELSLAGKITTSLVDTDGSESLSVSISNIPGGGRIISGSNTYYPVNGSVTIPVAQLAAAKLLVPEEFSGKIELGVTSTAVEASNGSTASIGQSLVFHVFQPGLTAFPPPTLAVSNATAIEGDYCVFNVALSSANPTDAVVSLAANNGTAIIGADTGTLQYSTNGGASWTTLVGNLTIPAGTSSVLVRLPAIADSLIEGTETFSLTATRVSGTLANSVATGTGTIYDLDSAPILSVRPIGQWLMDEGVGPTATNEYRSIIGTLSDVNTGNGLGMPQWVAGHSSTSKTAVQFDGKGAALATDPGELAGLSNSATVTFWIKTTQNASTDAAQFGGTDIGWNRPSVLGSEQNGAVNDAQWGWLDNSGRIAINVGDTAGAKSTTVVADGTWHYIAITRNATTGQTELYVDGVREGNVTASGLAGTITNVFGIGYTNGVNGDFSRNITNDKYLNGAIDDLRIYSSVLTAEQVQSIRRVETDHQDIAIANDGSTLKLAVTAAAYDSVTISGLLTGWVVSDGTHTATSTGTTNGIDISAWDLSAPLTITGVGATQSALLDITATKGVHLVEQSVSVVSVSNSYEGTTANNTFAGTANSDLVFGYDGDDNLSGAAGDDRLVGGLGVDTLNGGSGADILEGGAGNDSLTGGAGADVFVWKLADRGTVLAPAVDTVTDFDPLSRSAGGDSLDLRDLLVGETTGTALGQDNLGKYLHFEKTGASETTLHVSTSGGFASGYATGVEDQKIILQGADLTANGTLSDQAIIQDLLTKGKLITD